MYVEFKPGEKHGGKGGDISENINTFRDAGYILEDNDLVVDIDNLPKDKIKKMIETFDIQTETVWTDRGVHFYFKKPVGFSKASSNTQLAIPVEYKHKKNTYAVTVKRNGKERVVVNKGIRETLPDFLKPGNFQSLIGLSDGEGRNNALYSHKMAIGYKDNAQSILRFVNNYVFDEPLSDKEFEEVTRHEVVPQGEKGKHYEVADYVVKQYNYVTYAGNGYFKNKNGDYINDDMKLKKIIYKICNSEVTTAYVDEVKAQMDLVGEIIDNNKVFRIKFNNGYLLDGEFIPIVTDEFSPYKIDIDYKVDAEPVKIVDDYINHLTKNDEDYRNLLLEVLGHTLVVNPEFKRLLAKFFIFIGEGGNGKGTLLQIIKTILNPKNVTGMSISELSDERYLASFKGKLANLGDDLQDQSINDKDMKVLKNITTCDYMSTRELYKQSETMQFTGSLIFTSNHLIKSFEKGKSYKRRVMWLPMYTEVKEEDKDPQFITKLTSRESLEYWTSLIVEGYKRLYKNNGFTKSEIVEKFNIKYHEENNPYLDYLRDHKKEDFIDKPIKDVYQDVEEWCEDNAITFSQKMFRETMKEIFRLDSGKMKKVNGKTTRVFGEIE